MNISVLSQGGNNMKSQNECSKTRYSSYKRVS